MPRALSTALLVFVCHCVGSTEIPLPPGGRDLTTLFSFDATNGIAHVLVAHRTHWCSVTAWRAQAVLHRSRARRRW